MFNILIRFILLLSLFSSLAAHSQITTPDQLPNLALWLRSDTGITLSSGFVSQWNDISGNSLNAQQSSSAARPAYSTAALLNNKPVVQFDGINDVLNGLTIAGADNSSLSIFVVAKGNSASSAQAKNLIALGNSVSTGLWLYTGGSPHSYVFRNSNAQVNGGAIPQSGYPATLFGAIKCFGQSVNLFRNGINTGTSTNATASGSFTNGAYTLGTGNSTFFTGDIAEVIVYKSCLSNTERMQIEEYLYNRYAPPVSLGPDIIDSFSLCPKTINAGNRFVTYAWSTGATTSSIQVNVSGSYSVTVTDVFGRVSADTINVTLPALTLLQTDTTICYGNSILLSSTLSFVSGYTYLWQDGSTGNTYAATSQGEYYVNVSDGTCTLQSDTITVTVDLFPSEMDLGNDTSVCAGSFIGLSYPSSNWHTYNFTWSTGSNDSVIAINTSGIYAVSVTNSAGCTASDSLTVTVLGSLPIAAFNEDTLCEGDIYTPQNSSISTDTSSLVSYFWDFGDGNTSNAFQPGNTYVVSGAYQVTLQVTTSVGCKNTTSKIVLVNENPQASFMADTGCIGLPVQFNQSATITPPAYLTEWHWNFGDNTFSTLTNPSHLYTSAGTYPVTLIVKSNTNCFDTLIKNITVVNAAAVPSLFNLISPPIGTTLESNTIVFTWQASANATKYKLLVATNPSFTAAMVFNTGGTTYTATLPGNQTYYWKVRAYNFCNDSVESATNNLTIFSPADISNLALWLKSDTGIVLQGGNVKEWKDISGNNHHCVQNTPAAQPQYILQAPLVNFYPSVKFNGTSTILNGTTIPDLGTSSLSVFVVAQGNSSTSTQAKNLIAFGGVTTGLWIYTGGSPHGFIYRNNNNQLNGGAVPQSGYPFTLFNVIKDFNQQVRMYKNSTLGVSSASGANATNGAFTNGAYTLGSGNNTFFTGELVEIIVYSSALDSTQRKSIENYIYNRYVPPVNLGPDIHQTYSLCPVILDAQNRFVSYLWSTGETTSSIEVRKSGTYWVQTTDVFGRTSSDTINVTIPYLGMNITDTLLCIGSSVTVAPVLASSPYTYLWNNAQTTPSINVTTAGNYVCSITDNNNCTFVSDTTFVGIDTFTYANLLPTDTAMCVGNELPLNLQGSTPQTITWSDNSSDAQLTVYAAGNYSVTVTNTNGCTATDMVNITTKGTAPMVNFSAPSVCFGAVTNFTDETVISGADHIKTWHWDFGGAGTSNLQNPSKIFPAPGTYNVTLSVVTDSGCTGVKTKPVVSAVPPEPSFTFPPIICGGTPVTLVDKTVFLFGDTVTGWIWTFNGTDTITTQNAVYQFPGQGTYNVSLTAISKSGCKNTYSQLIDVFPSLTANFTVSNTCLGDSTSFEDITPTFSVVSWLWNFGDFSPLSNKQNPKHKFNTAGTYTVTLTVENAIGCKDDVTKQVVIVNKPTANFGNLTTCEDRYYTPLDSSTTSNDTISVWRWTIAGTNYTGKTPSHLFTDSGNYSVKLKVTTQKECVDSITKTVSVKPNPKAQFSYTPLYGDAPVDVSFINQSLYGTTYLWNFGDGDVSTLHSPIHTYATNDTFLISLRTQSAFGCVDSTQRIFIAAPTELDIAVISVTTNKQLQPDGSYLVGVEANVSNMATRVITDALFYITIGSGGAISEEWNGLLNTGETQPIAFTAKFVVAPENANSYVCVRAVSVNNGETELRTDNNQQCTTVNQGIQLVGPSPNPMNHQATLGIILPKAGEITIDIVNTAGQYIVKGEQVAAPKGRSDYALPADKMRIGEYYIRVYYNDEMLLRKFIVAK